MYAEMPPLRLFSACWMAAALLLVLLTSGVSVSGSSEGTERVVIDAYPNTAMVEQGSTLVLVCRVVGVPSTTVLSYQWTCPGDSCDAGAVDSEWAAKVQQGNILVVNVRNGNDGGNYTCTVVEKDSTTQQVGVDVFTLSVAIGLSFLNEDGGLGVFFPTNSFVTNSTLTNTIKSGRPTGGNDHIACYGGDPEAKQVTWHDSSGGPLAVCLSNSQPAPCGRCGPVCDGNGAVGLGPSQLGHTDIHLFTGQPRYVNQDLQCRVNGGQSAFIGMYLKMGGVSTALQTPSPITQGANTTNTTVSISWSPVSGATGYYVSYQRQDLGAPPVVTPQYERVVGGASTSVTLSGLEPGTTYRIRVWSTDGTSVSSEAREMDVTTVESAPTPPRMLTTAGNTTSRTVELNWLPPLHLNGAIHYEIEYEPAMPPGDPVNAGNSSTPYFTLTLPNEFLSYTVRVVAVNSKGQTKRSDLLSCPGKNREKGPQPPTGVSVDTVGDESVDVSWDAQQSMQCDVVIGNYSVRYQLKNASTAGYTTVYTSETNVTLQELEPGTYYRVSVASITSNSEMSAYSDWVNFTTAMAIPSKVFIDAYPNTAEVEQGTTLVLVCRVVGVPSTTVLSYQWTCPGSSCDAGAVDPEWAAKVQQGNIMVVNVRNANDGGTYTCTVMSGNTQLASGTHSVTVTHGLSFLNEDGGLKVFFPKNSFVTDATLTNTNTPRRFMNNPDIGNDHIACYGGDPNAPQVTWHNSSGPLAQCLAGMTPVPCEGCGPVCEGNGAVGVDPSLNGHTSVHLFTNDPNYVNQDLQCQVNGGQSAFIGVYLNNGASTLSAPSMTSGATTATTVSVSWSPVTGATGYYMSYQRQDLRAPPVVTPQYERIVGGASTSVTLSGLVPGTTYRIRVWSTNGASVSSEAREMDVTTGESAPSPPRMLTMIGALTGRTVELNWLPPRRPNGDIRYAIVYEPAVISGDPATTESNSSLYFTLTLPNDLLSYNVRVVAVNGQGRAVSNVLVANCTGTERGPDTPTGVSTVETGRGTVMVSWNSSLSGMCDVLSTDYSLRYRLSGSTGDYTTVNTSDTSVTLVDLVPNAEYDVEVAAINSNGAMSNFSAVAQFTVPPQEAEPTSGGTIAAVVIVLLVLIMAAVIAAVAIAIIFWRRKKKGQPYKSSAAANKPVHMSKVAAAEYDYANIADIDTRTVSDNPNAASSDYAVVNKKSVEKMPGVGEVDGMSHTRKPPARPSPYKGAMSNGERPLMNDAAFDGFLKQVEQMHSQGKSIFETEFNSIEKATASSTTVAELNNVKNRYKNIFPYDSSRVLLSVPNTSGTDYINASFIDGYHKKDSFIACQAPVPGTVDDFWQMMWDQRINIVVMLTKTMEGSKRKSEDYYPESPGDTFSSGRFQIRTISLKYHVDYEVRVLEVAPASNPSQTHTLDHYLFTGWPDYGVPKYPTSLIRMLYHVRDARVSDVPIVVHCSAGVGRSGTFIALDITLDQMNAEKAVDIKGTVKKMREKRMQMIQTPAQYIFVYDAVRELLLLGDTTIKANELRRSIAQLKSKSGGKGTGYQQQFASLNTLTQESADDEMVEDIPQAIRYPDRAPIKGKHLYVSKPEAGGTFFINASYVDGYHAHRAFIAAQSPLQHTVTDFWTLISEKKVQTVLLLCQLVEDAQDTCHVFWPAEGGTVEFGKMKVLLLQKSTSSELDTYRMTIQKPRSTQDVTLLHYKQWPEKRRPRSASFLKLFTSAQKLQQPHSNKPILVACNDGLGRTGTFIAIWSLIEQMKAEGQIDVVGTVKSIRTQRPGAVPLMDQYVYCHDILLEYVDSFEGYSNFDI